MLEKKYRRDGLRESLGAVLEDAITGEGNPAHSFFPYQVGQIKGRTPVSMIVSAGLAGLDQATMNKKRPTWLVEIWNFALWKDESGNYTEADAENLMDQMAAVVIQTVSGYEYRGATLELQGATSIRRVIIDGETYLWEAFQFGVAMMVGV